MLSIYELQYHMLLEEEKPDVFVGSVSGGRWNSLISRKRQTQHLMRAGLLGESYYFNNPHAAAAVLRLAGFTVEPWE